MNDPISTVLGRLRGRGFEPSASGNGYSCRCPAHEDRSPSLTIGVGDDGRVLLHCHGGCTTGAVMQSLGLEVADLFPEGASSPRRSAGKPTGKQKPTFPTWEAALAAQVRSRGEPAGQWHYHDAAGRLVGIVVRWQTGTGKTFLPISITTSGLWCCEGMPTPRPLYRLPQVLAAEGTVYVAEGEKAADALVALGLVATTSPNGSQSAGKADWGQLRGRQVVIIPDHDKPGEAYAADVVDLAHRAGAESVKVVRLIDLWPGLPEGGDAVDWIEHHDAADVVDLREGLEALVAKAEPLAPPAAVEAEDDAVISWEPFPTDALPEPLATFVRESARGIGCDESMVALPLLAAVAGAIGNARVIEPLPGWKEPAVLWTGVVSESGSGKTPAFRAAMQFADAEQKTAFKAHGLEVAGHETALMEHDAETAEWRKHRGKGTGGPAPEKPAAPSARRLVVNDSTIEALVPILAANPRGVLVAVDELAGLVHSFGQYKSGGGGADRAKWLSMHSAGPVTVDRKTSGTLYVESAAVSICGGVQPGVLAKTMSPENVESGLLGRLLLTMPPRRHRQWATEPVGFVTIEAVKNLSAALYAIPMPTDGPRVIDFNPDGLEVFRRFWEEHEQEVFAASGALRAMLAKIEAAVVRLALVIHVCRQAAGEPLPDRVDAESINRAIVLGRWFAREGRRVYGLLLGGRAVDQVADDAVEAATWIESRGRGGFASIRDLRQGPGRFRGEGNDRAEVAARRLVTEGRAVWESPATGGRPPDGIRLTG